MQAPLAADSIDRDNRDDVKLLDSTLDAIAANEHLDEIGCGDRKVARGF
jgi:hypothetical protein